MQFRVARRDDLFIPEINYTAWPRHEFQPMFTDPEKWETFATFDTLKEAVFFIEEWAKRQPAPMYTPDLSFYHL